MADPLMQDPTGGVSQADPEKIARSLVGDDLVNRYGDVMGVRKTGAMDVARDFMIGMQGGPAKVQQLRQAAAKQYQDAYFREKQQAILQQQQNRQQGIAMLTAIQSISKLPIGQRGSAYRDAMKSMGVNADPSAVKMFTDEDMLKDVDWNKMFDAVNNDQFDANQLKQFFGTVGGAVQFFQQMQAIKQHRQGVQKDILEQENLRLRNQKLEQDAATEQADPYAKARVAFRERMSGVKVKDAMGTERPLSTAEIMEQETALFGLDPRIDTSNVPTIDKTPALSQPSGLGFSGTTTSTPTTSTTPPSSPPISQPSGLSVGAPGGVTVTKLP